ncbi:MAG: tyrosine-type recombinase/integrase [Bacteroidota bacterium]
MDAKIIEIRSFLQSKGLTDKSIKTYCNILSKIFINLGYVFTQENVELWLTKKRLQPRTYNLYRQVINFYTKKYLYYELSFTKSKVPKHMPNYVSIDVFKKILSVIPNLKHRIAFELMYCSGLRVFEVVRLKKYNINLDSRVINVRGKGNKDRKTIIRSFLIDILDIYIKSINKNNPANDYLIQSQNKHLSERSLQERLKKALIDSNSSMKITCHDFRHSFAVNLLKRGINIEYVRRLLGHSSLRSTQIYLQCLDNDFTKISIHLDGNITQCVI